MADQLQVPGAARRFDHEIRLESLRLDLDNLGEARAAFCRRGLSERLRFRLLEVLLLVAPLYGGVLEREFCGAVRDGQYSGFDRRGCVRALRGCFRSGLREVG